MISHVDNLRMLIATIGDENELPAKGGTLDSSTGEDGICIFDGVVGTRDEDARAVGVAGSANVGWDLMTMMKTVDLRNQDVRRSNLRGIKESWRGDEYGFENLVVEDVDFVVDVPLLYLEENQEKIAFGRLVIHALCRRKRDSEGMDTITHVVELIRQGAMLRVIEGDEESIRKFQPGGSDVVAARGERCHWQADPPIVDVGVEL